MPDESVFAERGSVPASDSTAISAEVIGSPVVAETTRTRTVPPKTELLLLDGGTEDKEVRVPPDWTPIGGAEDCVISDSIGEAIGSWEASVRTRSVQPNYTTPTAAVRIRTFRLGGFQVFQCQAVLTEFKKLLRLL